MQKELEGTVCSPDHSKKNGKTQNSVKPCEVARIWPLGASEVGANAPNSINGVHVIQHESKGGDQGFGCQYPGKHQ